MYYYYVELRNKEMPFFETEPDRPSRFKDIVALMMEKTRERPVFSKDMAYYVLPEITRHPCLAQQIQHLFLLRDPRKSLMSYYRLDPGMQCEEVGIEALWRLHQWVFEQTGSAPVVVQAEKVQRNPQQVMQAVWRSVGLPYLDHAFSWDTSKSPADWKQVSTWHQKTQSKSSIQSDSHSDQEIQKEFSKMAASSPQLHLYLDHHMPFYNMLLDYSI